MDEIKEYLKKLGYEENDIEAIVTNYALVNLKPETLLNNIKRNYEFLISLGYSQADVIKMTKSSPSIYGYGIENIKQKIEFYDSIGLHSLAVIAPKNLMQSTELSYARYMFYKEKGIDIDETNYRKLFIDQKKFENQYGVKKEALLAKYDYKKYIEGLETKGENTTKRVQELGKETIAEQKTTKFLDSIVAALREQQEELDNKKYEEK